ncbi:hypothetical protein G8A07_02900 [Roseateles sp. DAIF2]|uniref:hypothetical protein n=1 Tax=Roseateles sp. DAIF2 TaxID=2714952 RepID=UPI0018A24E7B|nr:hypothetical protein [Roseateles sp. DAIF2]QPF71979.1 hypothetical protein G8A07_02900 [Roseateles sp. DAIF2]
MSDENSSKSSSRSSTGAALDSASMNPEELALLVGLMRQQGYSPADFELVEDAAPELSTLLGLPDHLLTLRRKSTGHEQFYTTQSGTPWLFTACDDLSAGRFGPAATSSL